MNELFPPNDGSMKVSCHNCNQKMDITNVAPFSKITCKNCQSEMIVPAKFKNFLIQELIAVGNLCSTYRALDLSLNREVAIKILNTQTSQDAKLKEQFLEASQQAATINHPNVADIFSIGEISDHPYIVMQYLENGSLARYLSKKSLHPLDLKQAINFTIEAAKGLQEVHTMNVTYGDLCPHDLFLDADNHIKISDIGLSGLRYNKPSKTKWHYEYYFSPECIKKEKITTKSDIYSLGAILYHMLTGYPPVIGDSIEEIFNSRLNSTPVDASIRNPQVTEKLNEIIMNMISINPDLRPQNMNEVVTMLSALDFTKPKFNLKPVSNSIDTFTRPVKRKKESHIFIWSLAFTIVIAGIIYTDYLKGDKGWFFGKIAAQKFKMTSLPNASGQFKASDFDGDVILKNNSPQSSDKSRVAPVEKKKDKPKTTRVKKPMPHGIDFASRKDDLTKYIKSFPTTEERSIEMKRINLIAECRSELTSLLLKSPYAISSKNIIKVRVTPTTTTSETCVSVTTDGDKIILNKPNRKHVSYSWNQIPVAQLLDFYDYYIKLRIDYIDAASPDQVDKIKQAAAETTLRAALLADWYNDSKNALKYAKLCVKIDPAQRNTINGFFADRIK